MKTEKPELLTARYWTAGEELSRSATDRGSEFPSGASDPPDALSRRGMLGLMGASLAFAGLQGCRRPVETIVPFTIAPEDRLPGKPEYYATTMPLGTAAYGVLVESHEGRPTKIEGNTLHPASRGAANAWMQASILGLYDPDRTSAVSKRSDDDSIAPSTWDEFREFWQERAALHIATGGADLAVISEGFSSPTFSRLTTAFRERFPNARLLVHEPIGDQTIFAGIRLATGRPLRPVYHFDRASLIVSLDADPLVTDTDGLAHARGFAAGRQPATDMNRLYAVESTLSLTGAAADHRLRVASSDIPAFVAALAAALAGRGVPVVNPSPSAVASPEHAREIEALAEDLAGAGDGALVIAGRHQEPRVHALVHAINTALAGPVTLHPLTDVGHPEDGRLEELLDAIRQGQIATLVALGGNPAYDTPSELGFADAIAEVPTTVHLTEIENETTRLSTWVLPRAHFLESWGDARSVDGTASVVQPLISPLFGGRTDIEILALMATDEMQSGYELVRSTWRRLLADSALQEDVSSITEAEELAADSEFDRGWRRVLHDGAAADSSTLPVTTEIDRRALATAWATTPSLLPADSLEMTFRPSAAVYDGRFANNSWLQEIPDPLLKTTWTNAALISPTTAGQLGIRTGDVLRLGMQGRQLEIPAFILPGQADRSLAVTLGYGRSAAGRVGTGVGSNAYQLRGAGSPWTEVGLSVERVGTGAPLVQTQEHWRMEGRHLVREATLGQFAASPDFAATPEEHLDPRQLWPQHAYDEGPQWGMAIDLNTCIGCNACVVACQSENNIPVVGADQVARGREMQWLRIDRYFTGELEAPQVVFQPVTCQHCENAPCEQVCPVAATVHDAEGLNVMVYNRCIGTRYCSNNCPYKVRRFNFYNFTKDTPELVKLAMNPDVTVRSRGVMEKCTFCIQRINGAKAVAKRERRGITDQDLKTACQQTCPTDAITFGDISNQDSQVAKVKEDPRNYLLLAELGNRPRTSYLAKVRNPRTEEGA